MLNKNLTVKNQTKILLVLILFLSCQQFFAQVSSISQATGTWNSIIKQDNFDPNDDQQAVSDTDLVGDAVNAMLEAQNINYIFSTGTAQDDVYFFRVRLGDHHSNGKLNTSFYLALDLDNDQVADVFVEANIKASSPFLAFHISDPSKSGLGPSSTGWENSTNNINIERELDSRSSFITAYDSTTDLDSNGETDTWLEFAFTEESIQSFATDVFGFSISGDTTIASYTFTSTSQTANGDIGGVDDDNDDLSLTWGDLGVIINGSLNNISSGIITDSTAPVITSSTTGIDLAENTGAGQTVYTITATDAVGVISYAIAGTDASDLTVNSSTGVVSLNVDPDYEVKNSYSFTVTASDAASNTSDPTTVTFSITDIVDSTSPVITLLGTSTVTHEQGTTYTDAGATATDSVDGDLTSSISIVNPVDVSTSGEYTITYNVIDAAGNTATQVTRVVTVVKVNVSSTNIASVSDQTYTGSVFTPLPEVSYNSMILILDTDYTISYLDNTNVGIATITYTGIGNYTGTKTSTFSIIKATPIIVFSDVIKTFGDVDFTIMATSNSSGVFTYSIADNDIATVSLDQVTIIGIGSSSVNASQAADMNYNAATKIMTLTINDIDTDGDGIGNNTDTDDDNDGTLDTDDDFPLDSTEDTDTDGDGIGNNTDTDDDNDGTLDTDDDFPLDSTEDTDTDGDGIGNNTDTDDDDDGTLDTDDDFPLDSTEDTDTDGDGIGNNTDTDDDGDGFSDADEIICGTALLDITETPEDTDLDGIPDCIDTDDDGDGYTDNQEVLCGSDPLDFFSIPLDNDFDFLPDCVDDDDDNDGILDTQDNCPMIFNPFQEDRDYDGLGDVCDLEEVNISEAFTPNGDGINDTWMIYNIENHPNNTVRVYNRWGREVFYKKSYQNDWDGTYQGNRPVILPEAASYYYQLDLNGDGSVDYKGWIYITK